MENGECRNAFAYGSSDLSCGSRLRLIKMRQHFVPVILNSQFCIFHSKRAF
ncbi:hypothetical protein EUMA32_14760 [Eubacterium maltosivorans]|nr:hypothetical protein EUMA32_14760 [Eubacterium maltosivorans]